MTEFQPLSVARDQENIRKGWVFQLEQVLVSLDLLRIRAYRWQNDKESLYKRLMSPGDRQGVFVADKRPILGMAFLATNSSASEHSYSIQFPSGRLPYKSPMKSAACPC